MQICKDTWHYRVYAWTYAGPPPAKTSLCRYVWRLILCPAPMALFFAALIVVGCCALVAIWGFGNVLTILTGNGFVYPNRESPFNLRPFRPISTGNRTIKMTTIAMVVWLALIGGSAATFFGATIEANQETIRLTAMVIGAIAAVITVIFVLYLIVAATISAIRGWEGWDVISAYLKARKEGVCPLITFE